MKPLQERDQHNKFHIYTIYKRKNVWSCHENFQVFLTHVSLKIVLTFIKMSLDEMHYIGKVTY